MYTLIALKIELFPGLSLTSDKSYPRHRMKILCENEDYLECERAKKNYSKNHPRRRDYNVVIIPKKVVMNPVSLKTIEKEEKKTRTMNVGRRSR